MVEHRGNGGEGGIEAVNRNWEIAGGTKRLCIHWVLSHAALSPCPSSSPSRSAHNHTMSYPEYENGEPPVVKLEEYDKAPWAETTCVDRSDDGGFVVVVMEKPEQIVAKIHPIDNEKLDAIFSSAHAERLQQMAEEKERKKQE